MTYLCPIPHHTLEYEQHLTAPYKGARLMLHNALYHTTHSAIPENTTQYVLHKKKHRMA